LKLSAKDHLAFENLSDHTVILRRVNPLDEEYYNSLSHALNEWESEDDEQAYGNL